MKTEFGRTSSPFPSLLTVKTACRDMEIGRTLLYQLCRSGQIKAIKIGPRGIRIPRCEIERFIGAKLAEHAGGEL